VEERALSVLNSASSLGASEERKKPPRTSQARGATEYKEKNALRENMITFSDDTRCTRAVG